MSGGERAARPALVGWIVDVQVDFMDPAGRLYVRDLFDDSDPGAITIIPALEAATAWMREHCDILVYTGDWHGLEDPEIDAVAPDPARDTYPPHCMGRSPDPDERAGAQVIAEIRPVDPVVLAHDAGADAAEAVARRAVAERRPVFVQKTRFNVFKGNPGCEAFVTSLVAALGRPAEFVVIGVARDVCMTQAVDGLQARGYAVLAVRDTTWGLGLEPEEVTLARWAEKGRVVTLAELEAAGL
ncbi:MAG: isochorismatase family protein [Gemmatimonadetes bacterium]|nr:isochorismatase family protein [Gemmatimonadota bacterium]MYA44478.1 isochorismatase family protein [Gemmatimonadota bacterium]MYE94416.1 isochorismatase family protein [Gemmatimonadota bacterium]MYJ08706.1 isochorismatase family protein [Gemmatimonadota bacterium]